VVQECCSEGGATVYYQQAADDVYGLVEWAAPPNGLSLPLQDRFDDE